MNRISIPIAGHCKKVVRPGPQVLSYVSQDIQTSRTESLISACLEEDHPLSCSHAASQGGQARQRNGHVDGQAAPTRPRVHMGTAVEELQALCNAATLRPTAAWSSAGWLSLPLKSYNLWQVASHLCSLVSPSFVKSFCRNNVEVRNNTCKGNNTVPCS